MSLNNHFSFFDFFFIGYFSSSDFSSSDYAELSDFILAARITHGI